MIVIPLTTVRLPPKNNLKFYDEIANKNLSPFLMHTQEFLQGTETPNYQIFQTPSKLTIEEIVTLPTTA